LKSRERKYKGKMEEYDYEILEFPMLFDPDETFDDILNGRKRYHEVKIPKKTPRNIALKKFNDEVERLANISIDDITEEEKAEEAKIEEKRLAKKYESINNKINKMIKDAGIAINVKEIENKEIIYVLRLEYGCWYIGYTRNFYQRMGQHFNGHGSLWTKQYKPLSIHHIEEGNTDNEDILTLKFMEKYGIKNVRGGIWASPDLLDDQIRDIENIINRPVKNENKNYGDAEIWAMFCG
jgi:predicted GIY-YIG superfamily endonuclease